MHKWRASDSKLLADLQNTAPDPDQIKLSGDIKTLGLIWNTEEDQLKFYFNHREPDKVTKRTVSSVLGQIFGPIGLISPIKVTAKIILKKLWSLTSLQKRYSTSLTKRDYLESELKSYSKSIKSSSYAFKDKPTGRQLQCESISVRTSMSAMNDTAAVKQFLCVFSYISFQPFKSLNNSNKCSVKSMFVRPPPQLIRMITKVA